MNGGRALRQRDAAQALRRPWRVRAALVLAAALAAALAATLAGAALAGAALAGGDGTDPLAAGRRIYREGVLPSGQPLQGLAPANVTLAGAQAACATCHRRSGFGSSEGRIEVRPITGTALFGDPADAVPAPPAAAASSAAPLSAAEAARVNAAALRAARLATFAGIRPRPVYDEAALARAVREGVDVTGRRMNPSMPRYALSAADLDALSAYLKTLSVQSAPGVTAERVHFATVIQPGTDPARRAALVDVLQSYLNDRNQGMRAEVRREETGVVRLRRAYREWVLHVWDLHGPSETWPAQLEAYHREQPVFALVSGLGSASWRPIHEFSERFELPCILPQADVPVLAERDFYTVYLSKGIALEAQALAKFLGDAVERGPLVQVLNRDEASAAGAQAFGLAWSAATGRAPAQIVLEGTPDEAYWQGLAQRSAGATLVLWLGPQELGRAQALAAADSPVKAVYLSSTLNGGRRSGLAAGGDPRVRMAYPQDLPAQRDARLDVAKRWLRSKGIALTDEKLQLDAYLAATVTGMVVSHSVDTYSREFVIERLEHRLGTAVELSIYPHLSLGPGQRFASKGSYVVQVGGPDDRQLTPVSDWIVP